MRRSLLFMLSLSFFLGSCSGKKIIPATELADIYSEMYLVDQSVQKNRRTKPLSDTVKIYEPVLEKYGYTVEDYYSTLSVYLKRPDKFEEIFDLSISNLEARKTALENKISEKERALEKWKFRDSVLSAACDTSRSNAKLRSMEMLFFERDSMMMSLSPIPDSAATASFKHHAFEVYADRLKHADTLFRVASKSID